LGWNSPTVCCNGEADEAEREAIGGVSSEKMKERNIKSRERRDNYLEKIGWLIKGCAEII
jgi:hypothetical protein